MIFLMTFIIFVILRASFTGETVKRSALGIVAYIVGGLVIGIIIACMLGA